MTLRDRVLVATLALVLLGGGLFTVGLHVENRARQERAARLKREEMATRLARVEDQSRLERQVWTAEREALSYQVQSAQAQIETLSQRPAIWEGKPTTEPVFEQAQFVSAPIQSLPPPRVDPSDSLLNYRNPADAALARYYNARANQVQFENAVQLQNYYWQASQQNLHYQQQFFANSPNGRYQSLLDQAHFRQAVRKEARRFRR